MPKRKTAMMMLCNETTASGYAYEVSQGVADMLRDMTEGELSHLMPKPSPSCHGYEAISYAARVVELAKERGIADEDICVCPREIPTVFFDTGWAPAETDAPEAKSRHHSPRMGGDATLSREDIELRAYVSALLMGDPMSSDGIREFSDLAELVDGQYESDGKASRFVRVVSACGHYFAVAPTYRTADLPKPEQEPERPWEVVRVPRKDAIGTYRWVPRDAMLDGQGWDGTSEVPLPDPDDSLGFPPGARIALDERFSEEVHDEWHLCEWLGDRLFGDGPGKAGHSVYGFYKEPVTGQLVLVACRTDYGESPDDLGAVPFALYGVSTERDGFGNPFVILSRISECDGQEGELDGYLELTEMLLS